MEYTPTKPGSARILFFDLSTGKQEIKNYDESVVRKFIGGYGLAAKIMFDMQKPKEDPLGPGNMLGFFTGLLSGTSALVASRFIVVGKSPLTGTWGDANGGGYFGPTLKASGFDGIFFTGVSDKPVYLSIEDGKVDLNDASEFWGMDTYKTEDALKKVHGDKAQLACIGPAGEMQSLIAGISTDKGRFAARSGLGAVMGSKKLKALVVKGSRKVEVADEEKMKSIRKEFFPKDPEFTKYGTAKEPASFSESGEAPVKNWGASGTEVFKDSWKITGDEIIKFQKKKYTCSKCPIVCGAIMEVPDGPFATMADTHKPQFESLGSFGLLNLINSPEAMIRFNEICNRTGVDSISAGGAVAFAIECVEHGLLSKEDVGGLDLSWGNAESAIRLTEMIGMREGIGELLADGVMRASEKIGEASREFAIHVGGEEVAMHDPKNTHGLAISYIMDPTPGRHSTGGELLTPPGFEVDSIDKGVYAGRARNHYRLLSLYQVSNCIGNCMLAYFFVNAQSIPQFVAAATGWDFDMEECLETGERIQLLRHAFNLREGYNPLDNLDNIPGRLLGTPPLDKGPNKGITVDARTMIREYLELTDWDTETTIPSKEKLTALGLEEVIEALY